MLSFREPSRAVSAATELVRQLSDEVGIPAHAGISAGPVIQRDRDVFGRTVNLASRIAEQAGPGEVVASSTVVEFAGDRLPVGVAGFQWGSERSGPRIGEEFRRVGTTHGADGSRRWDGESSRTPTSEPGKICCDETGPRDRSRAPTDR